MIYLKSGQISQHFWRKEFACKCGCGFNTVDAELIFVLERARHQLGGNPVHINSGCRCRKYNIRVGGSTDSQHMYAKAADITIDTLDSDQVAFFLMKLYKDRYGLGIYDTFTHIDTRSVKARWSNKSV